MTKRELHLARELSEVARNWEIYGHTDPLWAILMDPGKRGGGWELDEFLATGEAEIATVLGHLRGLEIGLNFTGAALDFGCGAGRLTQALSARFASGVGVDISRPMIELAMTLNRHPKRCRYLVNEADHLKVFPDECFAFIYSSIVLQHMPPRLALGYISEFARLLEPGGAVVFQVPGKLNDGRLPRERARLAVHRIRRRFALRTRTGRLLRGAGLLTGRARAHEAAVEMHCIAESAVREALGRGGLRLADVRITNSTDPNFSAGLRYLDAEPAVGYVSNQYSALKPRRAS